MAQNSARGTAMDDTAHVAPRSGRDLLLAVGCAFVFLLIFYVLPQPAHLAPDLDSSWESALVERFLQGIQFGTDMVFTYGPWGFLAQPRGNPAIYPWLVVGRLILAIGMAAGVSLLAFRCFPNSRILRWGCLFLVLTLADPPSFLSFVLFAVAVELPHDRLRTWVIASIVPAGALAAHVKMTAVPLLAMLLLIFAAHAILVRKRFPWLAIALVSLYAAFFLAAKQRPESFWPYLLEAMRLASSHSYAMYKSGSLTPLLMGALLCVAMPLLYLFTILYSRRWSGLPGAAWVAAYFFIGFKESFLRQDGEHMWMGMMNAALPASVLLTALFSRHLPYGSSNVEFARPHWNTWVRLPAVALISLLVAAELLFFGLTLIKSGDFWKKLVRVRTEVRELPMAFAGSGARQQAYQKEVAAWQAKYPLTPPPGSVDILPWDIFRVMVNGLDYRPRPIPQSYTVLNDHHARRNAEFFQSAKAPEFVFIDPLAIDDRYPSMMDNLAWRSLLANYGPAGTSGTFLLLSKVARPFEIRSTPLLRKEISWGEELEVPPSTATAVWAEVDIYSRPGNTLLAFLLRPKPVSMRITSGGKETEYRFTPLVASSGFLLSPVVDDLVSFAALYMGEAGRPISRPVSRVDFDSGSFSSFFYSPAISVRLYGLDIPSRSTSRAVSEQLVQLAGNVRSMAGLNASLAAPEWKVEGDEVRLQVSAPSAGQIVFDGKRRVMNLRFGLIKQKGCEERQTTVEFTVTHVAAGTDSKRVVMQQVLSLGHADRVIQLPELPQGILQFETRPVQGVCSGGAFWSRLDW